MSVDFFFSEANLRPIILSFQIALPATVLAAASGIILGALLAHRSFFGARLIDALLTSPLVLPPTVLGYYLLVAVGRRSAIGEAWEHFFDSPLVFTRSGAILAATVSAFPYILQASRAAIESVDLLLVEAARTLGANRFRAFFQIQLPLASRGIGAGLTLGCARSLGDFGITLMVAGNLPGETQTAALAIYDALQAGKPAEARALAIAMTIIGCVLMILSQWIARRPHA